MFGMMNTHWERVRKQCGQWFWTDLTTKGVYPSQKCASANSNLIANAFYILNGIQVRVDSGITESINVGLWSKVTA